MALNLYMHGIDPKLDFSNLNSIIDVYERCTGMTVPPRQPYAGELVFTAFSGSHQDAIKKGLAEWAGKQREHWDVPYLTIDPADIGREYREVIRVNSQSGKGGVAYLLESEFGIELPKDMQREFGPIANDAVDKLGREVSGAELKAMFWHEYVERNAPWQTQEFRDRKQERRGQMPGEIVARRTNRWNSTAKATARWPRWSMAFAQTSDVPRFEIANYSEHALSSGETAAAIAYIQIKTADGKIALGRGRGYEHRTGVRPGRVERVEPAVIRSCAIIPTLQRFRP